MLLPLVSQIAYSLCPDVNLMKNANSTFAYVSKRTIYNTSWNAKWISPVIQARSCSSSTISILYIVSPQHSFLLNSSISFFQVDASVSFLHKHPSQIIVLGSVHTPDIFSFYFTDFFTSVVE